MARTSYSSEEEYLSLGIKLTLNKDIDRLETWCQTGGGRSSFHRHSYDYSPRTPREGDGTSS
jgi:hypothetical protein